MATTSEPPAIERLLAHDGFVRGLARSLVADSGLAEDLVQQAWLKALEGGPGRIRSPRSWFATVVRNLSFRASRTEDRRSRREGLAARPEALPSTVEIVEREAARRSLVEAVLALEEPFRTAILLRYFEGLPPRAIASRFGARGSTVRARLARGLKLLRRRLDAGHGGDRKAWCLALVPLAVAASKSSAAAGVPLAGALVMKPGAKAVAVGVALLLVGSLAFLGGTGSGPAPRDESRSRAGSSRVASAAVPASQVEPNEDSENARRLVGPAPAPGRETLRLRGRLVLRGGGPLGEATVAVRTYKEEIDFPDLVVRLGGADRVKEMRTYAFDDLEAKVASLGGWRPAFEAKAGPDGSFELAIPADLGEFRFEVKADFGVYPDGEDRFKPDDPSLLEEIALDLEPAGRIEGTIRTVSGSPGRNGRLVFFPSDEFMISPPVAARDDGGFALRGLARGRYDLVALADGGCPAVRKGIEVRWRETTRVDIELPAEGWIEGRVVEGGGKGVGGARVTAAGGASLLPNFSTWNTRLRYGTARTAPDGSFRVGGLMVGEHWLSAIPEGHLPPEGVRVIVPGGSGVSGLVLAVDRGHFLSGRLLDADGKPVLGMRVTAFPDKEAIEKRGIGERIPWWGAVRGETGVDGSFRLSGLPQAPLILQVRRVEEVLLERRGLDPDSEGIDLVLSETGVTGRVLEDATGGPLGEFRVTVLRVEPWSGSGLDQRHAREGPSREFSSADGRFDWKGLQAGVHDLRVVAEGFVPRTVEDVDIQAGEVRGGLEFRLSPAFTVLGKVIDAGTGDPIEGALVEVVEEGRPHRDPFPRTLVTSLTDARGAFRIGELAPRVLRLRVLHDRFVESVTEPVEGRASETLAGLVIRLSRGGGVEGFARGEEGVPYSKGVAVALATDWRGQPKQAKVGKDGSFRIEGLAPGKWRIEAGPRMTHAISRSERDKRKLSRVVFVEEGRMTPVDFSRTVSGTAVVRGRVTRGGETVPGAYVRVEPRSVFGDSDLAATLSYRLHCTTDSDGNYRIEDVPAGEARAEAWVGPGSYLGSRAKLERALDIPDGGDVEESFDFPSGRIAGRVVRRSDGAPVPRIFVYAQEIDGKGQPKPGWYGNADTGSDGTYSIGLVPAGRFVVRAGGRTTGEDRPTDDLVPARVDPIEVSEGGRAVADFSLEAGGTAVVEVRDPEGRPVERGTVWLYRAPVRDPWRDGESGSVYAYGIARVKGLAPGVYSATATGVGRLAPHTEPLEVAAGNETRFRVDLREGSRVPVRPTAQDGGPVRYPRAIFVDALGRAVPSEPPRTEHATPEDRGTLVAYLLPGEYTLRARAPGFEEEVLSVRVGSESPEEISVRLSPTSGSR